MYSLNSVCITIPTLYILSTSATVLVKTGMKVLQLNTFVFSIESPVPHIKNTDGAVSTVFAQYMRGQIPGWVWPRHENVNTTWNLAMKVIESSGRHLMTKAGAGTLKLFLCIVFIALYIYICQVLLYIYFASSWWLLDIS